MTSSPGLPARDVRPAAFADAAGPVDFHDLLPSGTAGNYPYVKGKMVLAAPADLDLLPCSALTDADRLDDIVTRYTAHYDGADRRAVMSMWTMYYFSMLTIGAALAWLQLRRVLPLALPGVSICLDRRTAEPRAFVLQDFGRHMPDLTMPVAMRSAVQNHAAPLIDAICARGDLSPRLLWSNAAAYIAWISGEVGRIDDPGLKVEGDAFMLAEHGPDGSANPLAGMMRPACDEAGAEFWRRRICCLRYILPGVPGCGMTCPLPDGRF